MRGIPLIELVEMMDGGITPAHAGNTGRRSAKSGQARDHPRACGEY